MEPKLLAASSPTHATDLVPSPDTPVTVTLKDPAEAAVSANPADLTLAGVCVSPDAPMVQYTVDASSTLPVTVTDEGDAWDATTFDTAGGVLSVTPHLQAWTYKAGPVYLRVGQLMLSWEGIGLSARSHAPPKKLWNPQYE